MGVDHDTPVFALTSIEAWWRQIRSKRYSDAREIFITADAAGGSNGYRSARDATLRISLPELPEREEPNSLTPEQLADFLGAMCGKYPQH